MNREVIIERLLSEYQRERAQAHREADEARMRIAEKAPIYADFEGEMIKAVRAGMDGVKTDPDAGRKAIMRLRDEAMRQLREAGYGPQDLEPRYKCPECKDTAYVGMPIKQFCACFHRRLNLMLMKDEDIDIPDTHSFALFDDSIFPETASSGFAQRAFMQKAKTALERYSAAFSRDESRNVLIYGKGGLGKTFLMDCAVRAIVEKGRSAKKVTAYRLNEMMRKKHFTPDDEQSAFDRCLGTDLLAIDDLGSEPMLENVTITYLYALVSERAAMGKPTMITTNLNLTALAERYTERIFSRLVAKPNIILRLDGDDIRHGVPKKDAD